MRVRDPTGAGTDDMGEKPTPAHTLDRKDNDKGYEPSIREAFFAMEDAHEARRQALNEH